MVFVTWRSIQFESERRFGKNSFDFLQAVTDCVEKVVVGGLHVAIEIELDDRLGPVDGGQLTLDLCEQLDRVARATDQSCQVRKLYKGYAVLGQLS